MFQQVDIDGLGGLAELAGDLDVGGAGRRVTDGMVVGAEHDSGPMPDGFAKHLAGVSQAAGSQYRRLLPTAGSTGFCG